MIIILLYPTYSNNNDNRSLKSNVIVYTNEWAAKSLNSYLKLNPHPASL